MQFDNLFNGDKVLSEGTNKFLNENWLDILNELKPVLKKAIGKICNGVVSPIISKFPYNELFLWVKTLKRQPEMENHVNTFKYIS